MLSFLKHTSFQRTLVQTAVVAGLCIFSLSSMASDKHGAFENHHARMEQHQAQRQQQLKAALKLTANQEQAWGNFVATSARPRHDPKNDMSGANWSSLTTPQRLDKIMVHKAQRDEAMNKRFEAIKALYAVLDAEQKKVFDADFHARPHPRRSMTGHSGMHGKHVSESPQGK